MDSIFTYEVKVRYTFMNYAGVSGRGFMLDFMYAASAEEARNAISNKPALQATVGLRPLVL